MDTGDPDHPQHVSPPKALFQPETTSDTSMLDDSGNKHDVNDIGHPQADMDVDDIQMIDDNGAIDRIPMCDTSLTFQNLFCLLELISEQGGGGLVDKIIIAQDSLGRFINKIQPGAYKSLTKVDFKALDTGFLQPIGVYGSQQSIVSFFLDFGIVDNEQAHKLVTQERPEKCLQPGLYIALPPRPIRQELYIVFWPEKGTWRDDAPASVRRNRITFMRYLTQITHQILALFSDEESRHFVWNSDADDKELEVTQENEEEIFDRLFSFEVAKTLEQKEDIKPRQGFKFRIPHDILESASISFMNAAEKVREPRVLCGENRQGFLTVHFVKAEKRQTTCGQDPINSVQLKNLMTSARLELDPKIGVDAITILLKHDLLPRFPDLCSQFKERKDAIETELRRLQTSEQARSDKDLSAVNPEDIIFFGFLQRMQSLLPYCNFDSLKGKFEHLDQDSLPDSFANLMSLYPSFHSDFEEEFKKLKTIKLKNQDYSKAKLKLIMVDLFLGDKLDLPQEAKDDIVAKIYADTQPSTTGWFDKLLSLVIGSVDDPRAKEYEKRAKEYEQRAKKTSNELDDTKFLESLIDTSKYGGNLADDQISKIFQIASSLFIEGILRHSSGLKKKFHNIRHTVLKKQIDALVSSKRDELFTGWCLGFVQAIHDAQGEHKEKSPQRRVLHLSDIKIRYAYSPQALSLHIWGREETYTDPFLEYKIHVLELTTEHSHELQLDPKFVPKPHLKERNFSSFQLPVNHKILYCQVLSKDKLLLITDDQCGAMSIFLDTFINIGNATRQGLSRKVIHQEKTGKDVVIAFDEHKRMIALHSCVKALLYIFVFNEDFGSLQSWGHPVDLAPWYDDGSIVRQMCFVTGAEELLLVNNQGQARIFSLVMQQFRPASLNFPRVPLKIYPSPDGACFLAEFESDSELAIRAYHWTTFGCNDGIRVEIDPPMLRSDVALTSFINTSSIYLLIYDFDAELCTSVALDITKKATQFMFQEKGLDRRIDETHLTTVNNCLLDCFLDLWTRFPVLPAVQRQIKTSAAHPPKRVISVAAHDTSIVTAYFEKMIRLFEQKTRKPGGSKLRSIEVETLPFRLLKSDFCEMADELVSRFYLGEWIVEILCLIPIQLAITRENRFIPLKDGVISADYERSLLGADVSTVADSISFGWYESILQSYMAAKPVKVVSSMGEQSVGKSYALNHLVDTSFAGSAMRTTEGIWMSITPTNDALLVALDFEGVHSIERSIQEDTLLVLFNTAVSNLIMFRNNFALSRDITGLFQSFQSSSSVFDPVANPTLFCSKLFIIIKDVVDSDKREIVREFKLKFQKIVQEEQESNFITRLHRGQLGIVPWPVIESKEFYALFPTIKAQLDKQPVTHGSAGSFLQIMKTLMAKLKANDWRALSQSMAGHRAHKLLLMLPNALAFGYSEIEPHPEPLKDFDADMEIDFHGTDSHFFLSRPESAPGEATPASENAPGKLDAYLKALCESWTGYDSRLKRIEADWLQDLSSYLTHLVDTRVNHVKAWISKNLEGFQQTSHANITFLSRMLDATVIDIRANTELCKQQCSSCHLSCLLNRRHSGSDHNCLTSHKCIYHCEFMEEHEGYKICGYRAGHSGKHICIVEEHLCGEPCILREKLGCLGECTNVVGHDGNEHRCSSRIHACGMPCKLSEVTTAKGKASAIFSCQGICATSSEIPHDEHICGNRMCPMKCELCNRMCSSDDHFHPFQQDAVHLCGEVHACQALCAADGICEIDTAPQSIEATFTGRHETFQYTKYSQVAKRLNCAIPIPGMQSAHSGKHCHTLDSIPFHFCETRCTYCGYYCTLPRGHPQQEHDTSHGSMSKTRWTVEDPDAVIELNGRKFGSDDDGAPMMCNLFCQDMGRHVHVDYCRAGAENACNGADVQHVTGRLNPDPDRPKDWITHELFWKRSGFRDPYSRDDRVNFAKCLAMCPGSEHTGTAPQPSYCTLSLFHAPQNPASHTGLGYTSHDGHHFTCKNPAVLQQAFHVIFVIDRSGSMGSTDRQPLPGTPVTRQIAGVHNNRVGAVYSALHGFWTSRWSVVTGGQGQQPQARRDAYSVLLFDSHIVNCVSNDFRSSPEQLLSMIMPHGARGGTNYSLAIRTAQTVMQQNWSTERSPVVIFLSDGECSINDQDMQTFCRTAITLGKPLSFHGVSFGQNNITLRRMAQIALDIQRSVPRDPLLPQTAFVESSFAEALDSVRLAETFLGIAESLKKPRGALMA